MTYMKALGQAEDGFYPLGANGMWHGGIHFGQQTGTVLNQDAGVRAIADGEVVAYRLDSKYPELAYDDKRHALYSTGFVLIRHRLQLRPVPPKQETVKPAGSTHAQGTTPGSAASNSNGKGASTEPARPVPADETLTFFSLYMHLADWNSYKVANEQAKSAPIDANASSMLPMPYWEGDRWYRVGSAAKDKQQTPRPKAPLPRDTIDQDLLGEFIAAGFVQAPKEDEPKDEPPAPPPVTGLRVLDAVNGKIIGLLPIGAELTVSETSDTDKTGWARIATIRSGQPMGAIAGKPASTNVSSGWVHLKELDAVVDPKPLDQVVVLKKPLRVDAGAVVGHFGQFLRYQEAKPLPPRPTRPILHLEVFAGPELEAFIAKSRARAKDLPHDDAFLEISPGALLVSDLAKPDQTLDKGLKLVPVGNANASPWVQVQPKTVTMPTATGHGQLGNHGHHSAKPIETDHGSKVWVDSSLANTTTGTNVRGWTDLPLAFSNAQGPGVEFRDVFRRADLDKLGAQNYAKDDKGTRWWNVTVGTKDGGTRQGWVPEKGNPLARMCGPWDWPGFETVDSTSIKPIDMFRRYLYVAEQLLAGEDKKEFEVSASLVNGSDLITKLEKAVDADHNGKVTAQELAKAQQTPWMAEAISHLVVRCESEWGGGLGKWEALSPLMQKLLWLWKNEIERIGKLQWWEQVTGVEGFPTELNPWHFHPVGLIGNFLIANTTDSDDVIYLAKTLYGESRGQNRQSKEAVAWVIRNRVESGLWGKTYKSVVTARNQFTCWSSKIDPGNYAAIQNPSGPAWDECTGIYQSDSWRGQLLQSPCTGGASCDRPCQLQGAATICDP